MLSKGKTRRGNVQDMFLALVLCAIVVTGIGFWFAGLATSYPTTLNTSGKYGGVLSNATMIFGQTQGITNATENMRENPDTLTGTIGMGEVVSSALSLPSFIQSFLFALLEMSGLGALGWVINYLILAVVVILAFSVLNWLRGGANKL